MNTKLTIFIVEDDPIYSSILESNLKKQTDLIVYTYTSGEEMLENLHLNPNVVLLDFYLETMNGIDILKAIIGFDSSISVVFVSGQEKTDVAVDCLKFGAVDYIVKDEDSINKLMSILDKIRHRHLILKKEKLKVKLKSALIIGLVIVSVIILNQIL